MARISPINSQECKPLTIMNYVHAKSVDVIAHCPLVYKFCTFESESNDSYVCMYKL